MTGDFQMNKQKPPYTSFRVIVGIEAPAIMY